MAKDGVQIVRDDISADNNEPMEELYSKGT